MRQYHFSSNHHGDDVAGFLKNLNGPVMVGVHQSVPVDGEDLVADHDACLRRRTLLRHPRDEYTL